MNFTCRQCGACCRIPNGIVRVSEEEIARIAKFLGMTEGDFIAKETEVSPDRKGLVLKSRGSGACVYLTEENRCRIHEVKPDKCRTFPYEWTNPDSSEVCPGLGAGSRVEIALAADLNYYRGLTVTACSLAEYADPATDLRFHILHIGFSAQDMEELRSRIGRYHSRSEVVFHDVAKADLSRLPLYASSRMTYTRLLLPSLLTDCTHVIYSDVDILWMADIAQLWKMRSAVSFISCAREQSEKTIRMEREWFLSEGLPFDDRTYFCAGVSFYNLEAIRREDAFKEVFEFGVRHKGFNCADQSMLYGTLGGRVALLPDCWQSFPRNGITVAPGEPLVLHYAGEVPWKVTRLTHLITDTQLLWFSHCAAYFSVSRWRALRLFYSPLQIIIGRMVFLAVFRLKPLAAIFRWLLARKGCGRFEEALPPSWRRRMDAIARSRNVKGK